MSEYRHNPAVWLKLVDAGNYIISRHGQSCHYFSVYFGKYSLKPGINVTLIVDDRYTFLVCLLRDYHGLSGNYISDSFNELLSPNVLQGLVDDILEELHITEANVIKQTIQTRTDTSGYAALCAFDEFMRLVTCHKQVPRILTYTTRHLSNMMAFFGKNARDSKGATSNGSVNFKKGEYIHVGLCPFCTDYKSRVKNGYRGRRLHESSHINKSNYNREFEKKIKHYTMYL